MTLTLEGRKIFAVLLILSVVILFSAYMIKKPLWFFVAILFVGLSLFLVYRSFSPNVKDKFLQKVILAIDHFKPEKRTSNEYGYQMELNGWLKHKFPNVKTEVQTKESRPDIVIKNIAIEVKGPTKGIELDSVIGKLYRYTKHYPFVIVVLFDIQAKSSRLRNFERELKKYPTAALVKK